MCTIISCHNFSFLNVARIPLKFSINSIDQFFSGYLIYPFSTFTHNARFMSTLLILDKLLTNYSSERTRPKGVSVYLHDFQLLVHLSVCVHDNGNEQIFLNFFV